MAIEMEAKLRVGSHEPVREKLRALGAQRVGEVLEFNDILDATDGSLRNRGCGLRIRRNQSQGSGKEITVVTFKGPVIPGVLKTREEHEATFDDAEAALKVFRGLGFVRVLSYQKRRESWTLNDCKVELDEPPHIGLFVEIEGPSESAILDVQSLLGLRDHQHVRASYVRMLSEYCSKNGIENRVLPLPAQSS